MSHDRLIQELSSQLTPVTRRNAARETVWLVGLGALELALFMAAGTMRRDMLEAIGQPFMWWKLGSLAVLVAVGATATLRSFSPVASPRRGLLLLAILAGLTALVGAVIDPGQVVAPTLLGRLAPMHGLKCATAIVILSLPVLGMLSIFMRNGASTHAEASSFLVGLTGACWGAFVFAFCCPANDPLYVLAWYSVGSAVVVLAARCILPKVAAL